jgi:hypothetical protein
MCIPPSANSYMRAKEKYAAYYRAGDSSGGEELHADVTRGRMLTYADVTGAGNGSVGEELPAG